MPLESESPIPSSMMFSLRAQYPLLSLSVFLTICVVDAQPSSRLSIIAAHPNNTDWQVVSYATAFTCTRATATQNERSKLAPSIHSPHILSHSLSHSTCVCECVSYVFLVTVIQLLMVKCIKRAHFIFHFGLYSGVSRFSLSSVVLLFWCLTVIIRLNQVLYGGDECWSIFVFVPNDAIWPNVRSALFFQIYLAQLIDITNVTTAISVDGLMLINPLLCYVCVLLVHSSIIFLRLHFYSDYSPLLMLKQFFCSV